MGCGLREIAVAATLGFGAISAAPPSLGSSRTGSCLDSSAAFDGPAAALGLGMRDGILAAFKEANGAGGVDGRRLELVSYDDGYEPKRRSLTPSASSRTGSSRSSARW